MGDRGNCKIFVPNYFNPTKCQNCFKQKDQHANLGEQNQGSSSSRSNSTISRKSSSHGKTYTKTVLKESYLLKGIPGRDQSKPSTWTKFWYVLQSTGELQEYKIDERGHVDKSKANNTVLLQDYIRMLEGKSEITEDLCFGIKALRDAIYFKTFSRVDYENWWKEFSTFIAAPLKRTTSSAASLKSNSSYSRPNYMTRQYSVPSSSFGKSLSRSSRSSSISSLHSDSDQVDSLKSQVSKLEEENKKLSKSESDRRKLELEVNYWKEYVTKNQSLKRGGSVSKESSEEISETREKLIQVQDELNQCQKKLKGNTTKLLMQNKELADTKERLQEANSITAVYKAKIELLTRELTQKDQLKSVALTSDEILISSGPGPPIMSPTKLDRDSTDGSSTGTGGGKDGQNLEDKFLVLKDRLKRIERELFLKSKELEKANESRSKVAKYTRSLLQELESRLSDSQQRLYETEEKLKTANTELSMERERRIKSEEAPRRRLSSIVTPQKLPSIDQNLEASLPATPSSPHTPSSSDLTEHDADTKYADYYRSRYKEAESSLLEKDKKLHKTEEKLKEIQMSMKNSSNSMQVINDLQTKLSDATHKLSDRQLKIHELQRELDMIRGFEKTYERKLKQCETLEEMVKEFEIKEKHINKSFNQAKQELELVRIREIVLKEKLQLFIDENETDDDEDDDEDDKITKALDVKQKIENYVEAEALVKKLTQDNNKLVERNEELEGRLKKINIQNFKSLENSFNSEKDDEQVDKDELKRKIRDLESLLAIKDEKLCSELTYAKEKHKNEVSALTKQHSSVTEEQSKEITRLKNEKENIVNKYSKLESDVSNLSKTLQDLRKQLDMEKRERSNSQDLLNEKTCLLGDLEKRLHALANERDSLKEKETSRNSYTSLGSSQDDEQIDKLSAENAEIRIKNRKLERQLRMSLEHMDALLLTAKEKGVSLEALDKQRDSGIVMQAFIEGSLARQDSEDVFVTPRGSISSEPESVEKFKNLSNNYKNQLKDLTEKLIFSESEVLRLASELEKRMTMDNDINSIENKVNDIQTQIIEFHDSLTNKSQKLEAERENIMNLVEVTSSYIKKIEGSLSESKSKITELQGLLDNGSERPQPEGASASMLRNQPSLTKQYSFDGEDVENSNLIRQKLTAKIMTLQSDISELKENHAMEMKSFKEESQSIINRLEKRLANISISENTEELVEQIESLEKELDDSKSNYSKTIHDLELHFQEELKAAFSGDTGGIDMLNRVQELEIEIENTRKDADNKIREMQESFENEKQQIKDDMAMVLQASLSTSFSDDMVKSNEERNASVEELEERIISLEEELNTMKEKYEEELELERNAHRQELEDTVRDMMFVRNATNRMDNSDDDNNDKTDGSLSTDPATDGIRSQYDSSAKGSSEELENLKEDYEKKLQQQLDDHDAELNQVRSDMAFVIASLQQGDSTEMIVELQSRIKDFEQEMEDLKIDFDEERKDLESKLQRAENANFFGLRRQNELGAKIYAMQTEMEEIERKHEMEISEYKEQLGINEDDDSVTSAIKQNEELKDIIRDYEKKFEQIEQNRNDEIVALTMRLQEESQKNIQDLTDKVLQLESLIDSMERNHQKELQDIEERNKDENSNSNMKLQQKIKELENICKSIKFEYNTELEELITEHKREVENLRSFYEKEIGDIKKRSGSESSISGSDIMQRRASIVDNSSNKIKAIKEKHTKEIENLKEEFSKEKEALALRQEQEINDIRIQYDEKLKFSYKEGLRRQSVSERKSDATRMRELIAEKEAAATKLLELEIKYDNDTKELSSKVSNLQRVINEMKAHSCEHLKNRKSLTGSTNTLDTADDDSEKKIKEIQEQIERFERRIDYYREKSQRENCEESHRVSELQSEIVELHKEMNTLKENKRRRVYEQEKRERDPSSKRNLRRNTDGAATPRRHTDTTDSKPSRLRERDPRKRWSNLEERTEAITKNIADLEGKRNPKLQTSIKKEEGKFGTVSARKTLWENISTDDPTIAPSKTPTTKIAPQVK